ncbi:uncharacterized protein [Antedon mediterranea]|uniref:uncharacterized protein n=1 Tax=Antedon mediterranea TaxID=105859 RepID=UPI003AF4D9CC
MDSHVDDVLVLNVGGCFYTTSRSTLTRYPDSMLGAMFSGRLPSKVDQCNRYIIDGDGPIFRHVLNFLRRSKLILPNGFKDWDILSAEADFYQIPELIQLIDKRMTGKCFDFIEVEFVGSCKSGYPKTQQIFVPPTVAGFWWLFASPNLIDKMPCVKSGLMSKQRESCYEPEMVYNGYYMDSKVDEVLELNVGGCFYTTSRSTLIIRYPDSMLGAMFSGRLPSKVDQCNRYIIDGDGPAFRHVLNFLRRSKLILPEGFKEWDILSSEADFYQLEDLIQLVENKKTGKYLDFIEVRTGSSSSWNISTSVANIFNHYHLYEGDLRQPILFQK